MRVSILDDYFETLRTLNCFDKLLGHDVTVFNDHVQAVDQLAERLTAIGVEADVRNLRNKVARGGFSAVFFVQCLKAIGCESYRSTSLYQRTNRSANLARLPPGAKRLTDAGIPETEGSITVKINQGAFPAWFLIAAMEVIGASSLRLLDS